MLHIRRRNILRASAAAAVAAFAAGLLLLFAPMGGADSDLPEAPSTPPPEPGDEVGLLSPLGTPVLGPDGQPLLVEVTDGVPDVDPPPVDDPAFLDGGVGTAGDPADPPGDEVVETSLIEAYAATLAVVAADEGMGIVELYDLLTQNQLIWAATGGSVPAFRVLLVQVEAQTGDWCAAGAEALALSDGTPPDLVGGAGVVHVRDRLVDATASC